MHPDSGLIKEIEQKLGLVYNEMNPTGNLCYVNNNEDLQDEYKRSFTAQDLFFFVKSFEENPIEIPENSVRFWKNVKKGKEI